MRNLRLFHLPASHLAPRASSLLPESLTGPPGEVYLDRMRFVSWRLARRRIPILVVAALGCMIAGTEAEAEELPLTRNVPIPDFQNRQQDVKPYNFDAPPEGMFRSITVAEGFEEELSFRRQHEMVPVNITDRFRVDSPAVFIVFQLHQHYQAFQVFGLCYPEEVPGLDSTAVVTKDAMYIALEDESGYLRLFPPKGSWTPGRYKVEIHVGEQINDISLIGTMRFTVSGGS